MDGVKVATVDLYSPTLNPSQAVYTKDWATSGAHTLEVRVLGARNASSTGTRVDVDAFVLLK